jgi:hypothetical protein
MRTAESWRRDFQSRIDEARLKKGLNPLNDLDKDKIEASINELLNLETSYKIPVLTITNKADEEQVSRIPQQMSVNRAAYLRRRPRFA